jgi:quercetin dioxygenase-like cupin family protein
MEHTAAARHARLSAVSAHAYDLEAVVASLWGEVESQGQSRAGSTLVKTPGLRLVVEALSEGARLAEREAFGPMSVYMLEGEVRFEAEDEVVYLKSGQLLALPSASHGSIEAVRNSSLLLIITPEERPGKDEA